MSDKDGGGIHQSPSFTFAPSDPAPAKPADQNLGQAAVASNPYQWNDEPTAAVSEYPESMPTLTDGRFFIQCPSTY